MRFSARKRPIDGAAAPLIYIPQHRYPNGFELQLDGEILEVTLDPANQRALVPWNGQPGMHELVLRAK